MRLPSLLARVSQGSFCFPFFSCSHGHLILLPLRTPSAICHPQAGSRRSQCCHPGYRTAGVSRSLLPRTVPLGSIRFLRGTRLPRPFSASFAPEPPVCFPLPSRCSFARPIRARGSSERCPGGGMGRSCVGQLPVFAKFSLFLIPSPPPFRQESKEITTIFRLFFFLFFPPLFFIFHLFPQLNRVCARPTQADTNIYTTRLIESPSVHRVSVHRHKEAGEVLFPAALPAKECVGFERPKLPLKSIT